MQELKQPPDSPYYRENELYLQRIVKQSVAYMKVQEE